MNRAVIRWVATIQKVSGCASDSLSNTALYTRRISWKPLINFGTKKGLTFAIDATVDKVKRATEQIERLHFQAVLLYGYDFKNHYNRVSLLGLHTRERDLRAT